ncbi:MAG: dihydrofolate reductase family protein [Anaerolineaceae bacterium]|nr:dihydrofolate reductase family protein [Anaerolineaceae bacterium]
MCKVIYAMSVSLDGFIETGDGDLDWGMPDEALHRHFNEQDRMTDVALYGRRLYETMAVFWPNVDDDSDYPEYILEYARIWKNLPKVVFSSTLKEVGWNSRLAKGDLATEVKQLKDQPGERISVGGATLAASLTALGLIDEYWLYVSPVVLGSGKPFFGAQSGRINLKLIESHTFGCGVVLLKYERVREG